MSPRLPSPAPPGPGGAPRAELRRCAPVPLGLRPRVHSLPWHGRMFQALVCRDPPGTDGVPHQEAASRGGDPLREGAHLPAGQMCGQDPQETLFGETRRWWQNTVFVKRDKSKIGSFL